MAPEVYWVLVRHKLYFIAGATRCLYFFSSPKSLRPNYHKVRGQGQEKKIDPPKICEIPQRRASRSTHERAILRIWNVIFTSITFCSRTSRRLARICNFVAHSA